MSGVCRIDLQRRNSKVEQNVPRHTDVKQCHSSVRGIVSRSLKAGDWIRFRLMCRERGSALFYPKDTVESDDLLAEINRQQYAHLLSADDQTILNEIIDREQLELLKQLEEDGEQPEACFIKQALEENNVTIGHRSDKQRTLFVVL